MGSVKLGSERFLTLQAVRAFAAISVLFYHTELVMSQPKYFGSGLSRIFLSGDSGVQLFFVLSGFVIFLAHRNEIGDQRKLATFFAKRIVRVYFPLWVVLAVMIPLLMLAQLNHEITASRAFSAIFALPSENEFILPVEWTLRHEVLFYTMFGLLFVSKRIGGIIIGAWMLASLLPLFEDVSYPLSFFLDTNHVLFGLGAVCAILCLKANQRFDTVALLFGMGLFVAIWLGANAAGLEPSIRILLFGAGAACIILGLCGIERRVSIRPPRWLIFLGDASYAIYLTHNTVVVIGTKMLVKVNDAHHLSHPLSFFLLISVAILIGSLFHVFIEKRLLSLGRRVYSNKPPVDGHVIENSHAN